MGSQNFPPRVRREDVNCLFREKTLCAPCSVSKDHVSDQTEAKTKILWKNHLWSISSWSPRQTDKAHVERHACLPGFTNQRFLGEKKPLLHWPTVALDNLSERRLNMIRSRPAQRMRNWHTVIWIFPPVHRSLGLFQSSYHVLKFYIKPGA